MPPGVSPTTPELAAVGVMQQVSIDLSLTVYIHRVHPIYAYIYAYIPPSTPELAAVGVAQQVFFNLSS